MARTRGRLASSSLRVRFMTVLPWVPVMVHHAGPRPREVGGDQDLAVGDRRPSCATKRKIVRRTQVRVACTRALSPTQE